MLTHGNGPQVGELALERAAATFDVLGAESMGQIGKRMNYGYCSEVILVFVVLPAQLVLILF